MSLDKYSALLTQQLSKVIEKSIATPPVQTQLNRSPMIQLELHGVLENMRMGFLLSFIETPHRYYQVRLYAKESEFQDGINSLKEITNSLVELDR